MLTHRQEQILNFIHSFTQENGFPPTVRDIGDAFRLSPATVHGHLKALEKKQYLNKKPNRSRSLSVAKQERTHLPQIEIPIVGRVAAGSPILAEENVEQILHLPKSWAKNGSFILKVQGDSMENAHILDGDYVLIHPQKTAENGEIIVALIDDEATVKRFYKKSNRVELRAENPKYKPIRVGRSDSQTLNLIGKVVGVLRF